MSVDVTYSEPCRTVDEAVRQVREKQRGTPRLTVGIPTHDRPEMLVRAVKSALNQTVPVQVLISDDNPGAGTIGMLAREFADDFNPAWPLDDAGRIAHRYSYSSGLWWNWNAAARACRTEFFLWLQDDDVIQPYVAARIASAFDEFPQADIWMAPNKIGPDEHHHWWNNGNGPWVPMRSDGGRDEWESEILAPTSYFLSWSLSPGVAFRTGERFTAMLDRIPGDCAIFAERLVLTGMGKTRFIADPCVAGTWIQHRDNEHRKLHDDQPRQTAILIRMLDEAMDSIPNWRDILGLWCRLQHPHWITGWLGDLEHAEREGGTSRYGDAIREVMLRSLEGRVKYVPRYRWWYRGLRWLMGKAAL